MLLVALLCLAPLVVLLVGGAKVRLGLIATTLVTGVCATWLDRWFDYPEDVASLLLFYLVVLPLVCGGVAGVIATWFVAVRRAFVLPIAAGVAGAYVALALAWFAGPIGSADTEDIWMSMLAVAPQVVVASSFAVMTAELRSRRTS